MHSLQLLLFSENSWTTDSEPTASIEPVNTTVQTMEATPANNTPSSSSSPHASPGSGYSPIGIWIAIVAAVLLTICNMTVVVCCIFVKCRASKKCVQATEEEMHHYDYIDMHGIYSETVPNTTGRQPVLLTPPATDVQQRDTEPYYTSIYGQPVIVTDRPQDHLTAVHTGQTEMTTNVAYMNHEVFDDSREYI